MDQREISTTEVNMENNTAKIATPPATSTSVNPILKHHSPALTLVKSSSHNDKKSLKWDENAIEEHDKLRGTRMKIDEPNTPYTHYDDKSDEESTSSGRHPRSPDENRAQTAPILATQWGDIESKLQAVANKRDACPHSPAPSHGSDSEDEAKKKERDAKFRMLRKQHYNEVEAMKRFRAEHPGGLGDEDDDDDEDMEG
mmetsp:Transcript_4730/g.10409  ORF Transcript_4730/g.10409 Transcript_4730/m.10409 type:complete len:199 (+) Transcript_4730:181-777(+)